MRFLRFLASTASPCRSEKKVKEMGCKTQILITPTFRNCQRDYRTMGTQCLEILYKQMTHDSLMVSLLEESTDWSQEAEPSEHLRWL